MSRTPEESDIAALAATLAVNGVDYALIGGAAMALHGFPRMTKDLDLLVPVDASNNERLIKALRQMPGADSAIQHLRREWMDKGHSTELRADIPVDILYVAADRSYAELRDHVLEVDLGGVKVRTLDVDGLLLSKQTQRASDVPDRIKLERLRNALRDARGDGKQPPDPHR